MKVKIFSFITAFSIGFSSLIFPFYSVSAFAQQAVIPWPYIFRFIAESVGAYAISKGADYAVDQLTGSGRKMTDDEYNATSKDWDACVSYMKSQGCTDSDIENLQAQIQGGDLDLSSKVGQAMQNYFAQKGSNVSGAWNSFNNMQSVSYPVKWSSEDVENFLRSYATSHSDYKATIRMNGDVSGCYGLFHVDTDNGNISKKFSFGTLTYNTTTHKYGFGTTRYIVVYNDDSYFVSDSDVYNTFRDMQKDSKIYCSPTVADVISKDTDKQIDTAYLSHSQTHQPSIISAYGGSIPHYFDNTIDNDDSSKNTYNNIPASIDWSKIFDSDDDKNPTFKKIDGYTPPEPKIKEDGSNYDEVIKQLQEANRKLAEILGWIQDFDYDNNGKIKDHRLTPIEPNTPLFNFKLSEKFPFSLPWDMLAILSILKAKPVAPKYEFPIMLPDETGKVKPIKLSDDRIGVIQGDKIVLDFTSQDWKDVAKILRWGELVLFICGLCVVFWKYGK